MYVHRLVYPTGLFISWRQMDSWTCFKIVTWTSHCWHASRDIYSFNDIYVIILTCLTTKLSRY